MESELKLWELANPSDPYTFYAKSVEVAAVVSCLLSTGFGAFQPRDSKAERTPVLFGWEEWFKEKGIESVTDFIDANALELAEAFDSFLIGDQDRREDVDSMIAILTEEQLKQWKLERQDRKRTSMNQIGEKAYQLADTLRKRAAK